MAATVRLDASSGGEPAARIDRLRRQLCALEAATGLAGDCGAPLALGHPVIDGALGGGLSAGALHEVAAAREAETAAASGFALAGKVVSVQLDHGCVPLRLQSMYGVFDDRAVHLTV